MAHFHYLDLDLDSDLDSDLDLDLARPILIFIFTMSNDKLHSFRFDVIHSFRQRLRLLIRPRVDASNYAQPSDITSIIDFFSSIFNRNSNSILRF